VDCAPISSAEIMEPKLTVLMVEDEFLIRWPAAEFLRERGYLVIEANSAADAISVFDAGTHVDCVFSDINMPGPLSGHDLAQWLDQHRPGVALLLTSASATEADKLTRDSKRRFIPKPYDLDALAGAIAALRQR
jgi:DNA-binding NtrC family response regulator